jgi:hypothetical protein
MEMGRKGKFWEDQEGVKARYDEKRRIFEAENAKTKEIVAELEDPNFAKKIEKTPFKDLLKGFSSDIAEVRIRKAKYDNLKAKNNPDDSSLLQWTGEDIIKKSDDIESQILLQIEATTDPYEKSDLDALRLELAKVTINVTGLPEKKVVNG